MDIGKELRVIEVEEPATAPTEIERVKVEEETIAEPTKSEQKT